MENPDIGIMRVLITTQSSLSFLLIAPPKSVDWAGEVEGNKNKSHCFLMSGKRGAPIESSIILRSIPCCNVFLKQMRLPHLGLYRINLADGPDVPELFFMS
jgi:hypothetical protein